MTNETGNPKPETGGSKRENRNSKLEIGSSLLIEDQSKIGNRQSVITVEEEPAIDDRPSSLEEKLRALIGNPQSAIAAQEQPSIVNPPSSVILPLLLEVGCEEIPARFLRDAEKGLGERVLAAVRQARLLPPTESVKESILAEDARSEPLVVVGQAPPPKGLDADFVGALREVPLQSLQTFSTPRRLVVHIPAVLAQQPDKVEEILGPPVKVAIDREGNYTRAAESFAQKNSARLQDLTRTTTPKGEYLSLRKTTPGRPAIEILPEVLPGAILGLTFPKSMYWTAKLAPRFVRPIRWIVALLGEGEQSATVDFKLLGVRTGNFTFGHRAKSAAAIAVSDFKDYTKKLSQRLVEIDYNWRSERIVEEAQTVVAEAAGRIVQDEWLVDWIANSTEWPRPMLGSFDERFLHLPREILITVMRDHQRYFAVEDVGPSGPRPDGPAKLAPHFVAVLNMDSDEKGLIRQGHQRVLTARFRDAEFFWNADQKIPLRDRVPLLDKVTYQAKLGSYGDKIRRMKSIAGSTCVSLEDSGMMTPAQTREVLRAVELSKCDLTTQMVQEFTELQGVVGGLYAKAQGEPEEISVAIYDHYLPMGAEGASPRTLVGAMVSLADKVDSVVAGFAVGNEPTGSSDPFALRRQANGIIKVILDNSLPLTLKETISKAISLLDVQWRKPPEEVQARVLEFLDERLRDHLERIRGFRYDTVRAVVGPAWADQPTGPTGAAGTSLPAWATGPMRAAWTSLPAGATGPTGPAWTNLPAGATGPAGPAWTSLPAGPTGPAWTSLPAGATGPTGPAWTNLPAGATGATGAAEAVEALRGGEDFKALSAAAKRIRNILAKSASTLDWQPGEVTLGLLREDQEKDLYKAYVRVSAEVERRRASGEYRSALEAISTLRPAVDRFFDRVLVMVEDREVRQNRLRLLKKLDELFSGIADLSEIIVGAADARG